MSKSPNANIASFEFQPGRVLARKYEVLSCIGRGYEGEVYLLKERTTGIERAAKIFFPHRNQGNKALHFYAKKLHKLRECPALIQYHTCEVLQHRGQEVFFLVSDFVEGESLPHFLRQQPGQRLDPFQGLHLLHALAGAIEGIHRRGEYHGDLHAANVIVRRHGIGFEVRVLDFFHWGKPSLEHARDDLCDVIRIFYDCIGGQARYYRQPPEVKAICLGLKRSLILKRFKTVTQLREHLETMSWGQTLH